ncbi:MAG: TPM domain-containing protein [Flavobacteriaceae bacterium]|nr:TPM domain-containing protein [Flavobacteriaceae bacterium]
MSAVENFLNKEEEQEIIHAIQQAEKMTSGEIRVHLEPSINKDVHERALEVFHMLEMSKTNLHNGVLFYVAVESKAFVIYGDKGINKLVSGTFWESTKEIVITHFKKGDFKTGLVKGILETGIQLQQYFPCSTNDSNELSDEISKG